MTFGDDELYPTLAEKAAALGFSLIKNHAFVDGNKRIGHHAMEYFLALNGFEIADSVDSQEAVIFGLAASVSPPAKWAATSSQFGSSHMSFHLKFNYKIVCLKRRAMNWKRLCVRA